MAPLTRHVIFSVLFTSITGLLAGYDLCIIASILQPVAVDFDLCELTGDVPDLLCYKKALFVSMLSPGAALGGLICGPFSDYFGRRFTLILGDTLILTGSLCFFFAKQFAVLLLGRFVVGAGIGVGFVVFSVYTAEIAPPERRGQLVAFQECVLSAGCLLSYAIAAIVPPIYWRAMLGSVGIVAFLQIFGAYFLCESPRWLGQKHRWDDALVVLKKLMGETDAKADGKNAGEDAEDGGPEGRSVEREGETELVDAELAAGGDDVGIDCAVKCMQDTCMRESCMKEKRGCCGRAEEIKRNSAVEILEQMKMEALMEKKRRRKDVLLREDSKRKPWASVDRNMETPDPDISPILITTAPTDMTDSEADDSSLMMNDLEVCWMFKKQILLAVGCAVAQNLTVSNSVLYFAFDMLKIAGIGDPTLAGLLVGVMKFLGVVVAIFSVERIGRKTLLLIGSSTALICHLIFSILFFFNREHAHPAITGGILAVMCLFIFAWNLSWAGLMFVVAGEILPSSVRGLGMGFTIATYWMLAFLFQSVLELLMSAITIAGAFLFFAVLSSFSLCFVVLCIKDFTGVSLENIDA